MGSSFDRALSLLDKGLELAQQRRYDEALEAYGRALKTLDTDLNPSVTAGIWINIGNALSGQQRYTRALAAYDAALSFCVPNSMEAAAAWKNKANVLQDLRRLAEAAAAEQHAKDLGL